MKRQQRLTRCHAALVWGVRRAQNLGLQWAQRKLGVQRRYWASIAPHEDDLYVILIFSFSGLTLSLFAIERSASLVRAIVFP